MKFIREYTNGMFLKASTLNRLREQFNQMQQRIKDLEDESVLVSTIRFLEKQVREFKALLKRKDNQIAELQKQLKQKEWELKKARETEKLAWQQTVKYKRAYEQAELQVQFLQQRLDLVYKCDNKKPRKVEIVVKHIETTKKESKQQKQETQYQPFEKWA